MNKQQLASKIWESANKMRSKIEANEYKDYILGFIFYKFLSDKEVRYVTKELEMSEEELTELTEDNDDLKVEIQSACGFYIEHRHLFSTWIKRGIDFNAGDVSDALNAFERNISHNAKKLFHRIFNILSTGLRKLGDNSNSQTRAVRDLVYLINDIPMDGRQDYDVLGYVYEYLLEKFAANAGKKAGEFYTPHEVSVLMSELVAYHLRNKKEQFKIYDPTSGSGSLLINIGKAVAKYSGKPDSIKYYAQELKENTYNLTRMNLVMRGILPANIEARNGDTLEEDWPIFEETEGRINMDTYERLLVDAVVSNPPYSQHWDPSDRDFDPRYQSFGLAPKTKADYAFLLHDLYHVNESGIMTIVLPHGVLFRGGEEGQIRKNLIEHNHIDTVIGLPANIFYGTSIPTIIMVLKRRRPTDDVLIIDASAGFAKEGKSNRLRASDIRRIVDACKQREDISGFSRVVSRKEIRDNDYNLNISRYVDSSAQQESWDIFAQMFGGIPNSEIGGFHRFWEALSGLRDELFEENNEEYSRFRDPEPGKIIRESAEIAAFKSRYAAALDGYDMFLRSRLVERAGDVDINQEEEILYQELLLRLSGFPLLDVYQAYEYLDHQWSAVISGDLEIIQSETRMVINRVEPNYIVRKVKDHDVEEQDGWKGRILPFDLVQRVHFSQELASISQKENRLAEIESSYADLLESLDEDAREKDFVSEDAFVWAVVKKIIKAGDEEPEILEVLRKASDLNTEEKKLKKEIQKQRDDLHLKTKERIENLTPEEGDELLFMKWTSDLLTRLGGMPDEILKGFEGSLRHLADKYSCTLPQLEDEISKAEDSLAGMLDELEGSTFDQKALEEFRRLLAK